MKGENSYAAVAPGLQSSLSSKRFEWQTGEVELATGHGNVAFQLGPAASGVIIG